MAATVDEIMRVASVSRTSLPLPPQKVERHDRQGVSEDGSPSLRDRVLSFCQGFSESALSGDKDELRRLYEPARAYILGRNQRFIERYAPALVGRIASGAEVDPTRVEPSIVLVTKPAESRLFRFASLYWSVPVSPGYGRRMRFLVVDKYNDKLIGVFGLCDPVFNLACRDQWIGWDVRQREVGLSGVMSAYVLGAVPPYSYLLGGKLVALLALSKEVREQFRLRYEGRETIIRKKRQDGILALITVTSALGRSSLYNRIKTVGHEFYTKIGETRGWGHHHLSYNGLFAELRALLAERDDPILKSHEYGQGPNWKFRLVRRALQVLDIPEDLLNHGLRREVYGAPLGSNWREYLLGESGELQAADWDQAALAELFRNRWLCRRAATNTQWERYRREEFLEALQLPLRGQPAESDSPVP